VRAEFDNQHNRTGEYEHQSRFDPSHDTVRASVQSMLAAKHGCVDGRLRHFICCVVGFLVIRPSYSRHEEVRVEQGQLTNENALLSHCTAARDGDGETEGLPVGTDANCYQTEVRVLQAHKS
jgi:hypothetical protein